MKTLRAFFSETEEHNIDESMIAENLSFKSDPPNIIVLKRKAIRVFPDGRKVALYYADKIDKYVSIPYSDMMHNNKHLMQVQEKWIPRGNIGVMMRIVDSGEPALISFEDNLSVKIDVMTAQSIINLYDKVNSQNKYKIERMVNKDKNNFAKVAAFSHGAHTEL